MAKRHAAAARGAFAWQDARLPDDMAMQDAPAATVPAPAPVGEQCGSCGYTFLFPQELATHTLTPAAGWLCARCHPPFGRKARKRAVRAPAPDPYRLV